MTNQETDQLVTEKMHGRRSSHEADHTFSEQYPAEHIELTGGIYLIENQFGALALIRQKALDIAHQRLILMDDDALAESTVTFHQDLIRYFTSQPSRHSDVMRDPLISLGDATGRMGADVLTPEIVSYIGSELERTEEQGALRDAVALLKDKLDQNEALLADAVSRQNPDVTELEHELVIAVGKREIAEEALATLQLERGEDLIKLGNKDVVIEGKEIEIQRLQQLLKDNNVDFAVDLPAVEVSEDEFESSTIPTRVIRAIARSIGLQSLLPNQK
jgi:hypothetical protein